MRIKTILSTVVFIFAFVFSTAFASLFIDKSKSLLSVASSNSYRKPCEHKSQITNDDLRMQTQILNFLEEDRQNGRELANDSIQIKAESEIARDKLATANLLRKMQQMKYINLPFDFQLAWENHVSAWEERADFLHRVNQARKYKIIDEELREEYWTQGNEINQTYIDLVSTARRHGVKFSY